MIYDDFSECEFIENQLKFYTYIDFLDHRFIIKKKFNNLTKNGRIFYKYYVYANTHINLNQKNKIWDYLNGYDDGRELLRIAKF